MSFESEEFNIYSPEYTEDEKEEDDSIIEERGESEVKSAERELR
jgi:hypothetical protein